MKLRSLLIVGILALSGCQTGTSLQDAIVVPRAEYRTIPIGQHELISVEDVSYARVRRFLARIRVGYENSPADIKAILKDVASAVQADKRARAVSVFAVGPDESIDGGYSAGMVVFAPGGDWGKADQDLPLEFVVTLGKAFYNELDRQRSHAPGTTHVLNSRNGELIEFFDKANPMDRVVARINSGTEIVILDEIRRSAAGTYLIRYRVKAIANGRITVGWVRGHSIHKD